MFLATTACAQLIPYSALNTDDFDISNKANVRSRTSPTNGVTASQSTNIVKGVIAGGFSMDLVTNSVDAPIGVDNSGLWLVAMTTNGVGKLVKVSRGDFVILDIGNASIRSDGGNFIGDGSLLTGLQGPAISGLISASSIPVLLPNASLTSTNFYGVDGFGVKKTVAFENMPGANTNYVGTFTGNGSGLTSINTYTIQTTTNFALVFNGISKAVTVTNFPNLILTGGTNGVSGSYVFDITVSNNIYGLFGAGYEWLCGSNANPCIVTNGGTLSITKIGAKTKVALLQQPYPNP